MERYRDIARQTVGRILGEAAFLFTDDLPEGSRPPLPWNAEGISLRFAGHPSGEIRMWVGEAFARIAAANMLGIDPTDREAAAKGTDALKELLNMATGNFLTEAFGPDPVFVLGLPERLPNELLADDVNDTDAFWLEAENCPVMFTLKTCG